MDVKISKGADIKLKGVADRVYANVPNSNFYALKPTDFHLLIPKMVVKIGDSVKAGDVLFYDSGVLHAESFVFARFLKGFDKPCFVCHVAP